MQQPVSANKTQWSSECGYVNPLPKELLYIADCSNLLKRPMHDSEFRLVLVAMRIHTIRLDFCKLLDYLLNLMRSLEFDILWRKAGQNAHAHPSISFVFFVCVRMCRHNTEGNGKTYQHPSLKRS